MPTKPSAKTSDAAKSGRTNGKAAPKKVPPSRQPHVTAKRNGSKPKKSPPPRTSTGEIAAPPDTPLYTKLTPIVQEAVLAALAVSGNITQVCEQLRVNRAMVSKLRQEDEDFAKAWKKAMDQAVDGWEAEAARRAFSGFERKVYNQGELVGTQTEYSDRLAELLLKGRRREYAVQRIESNNTNTSTVTGALVTSFVDMSDEDLNKAIAKNAAALGLLAMSKAEYYKLMGRDAEVPDALDPGAST